MTTSVIEKDNPTFVSKIKLIDKFIILLIFVFIILFVYFFSKTENLIILGIVLFILFIYMTILVLTIYWKYPHKNERALFPKRVPTVAVVTYAFNNFKGVEKTVERLCELEYPIPYNVYVINDGTMGYLKKYKQVKFITLDKKYFTKGQNIKATVMNLGFKQLKEENILCTDGDSIPNKDCLMSLTGILTKDTGAVIGFVKPSNTKNLLEKLQMFEYNMYFALLNYGFSLMNSLFVVCGPLNLINRKKFEEVGGFDVNNITEDADIAFAFRKSNYKIKHSLDAVAETDVPSTVKGFLRQRIRWYRGGFYTWLKYKKMFFRKESGIFGMFLFPYVTFLNIIGMAFLAQVIWNGGKMLFTYTIPYLYEFIKFGGLSKLLTYLQNFSFSDINLYIYLPPTTTLVFFTFCAALLLGIVAYSFANFKVKIKDAFAYILFILIYPGLFTIIYLYSLILEFISYKYRW